MQNRIIDKLKIYSELVRPFTLIAPLVGFFSGAIIASGSVVNIYVFIGALSAVMLNAASNVTNQYFDLEIDKINKPSRPLPLGKISKEKAIIFAGLLYFSSLILSLLVNLELFLIVSLTALVTFFYSSPPLRFKKHPFMSNFFIALARGMFLIVAGWSTMKPIANLEPWFVGLIFAFYIMGAATTKDFSDIKGDRLFGIKTLPILYGVENTAKLIGPFFYLPFMVLIPLGVISHVISITTLPLAALGFWGLYTAKLIMQKPQELTLEQNHVSWKHMYFILIVGQIGFALAYSIKR